MTKSDLVARLAEKTESTKTEAARSLEAILDVITEALAEGEKITLVGFGTFKVSERKAREGRNPSTGNTITIPASKSPRFVPGKALKDAVSI